MKKLGTIIFVVGLIFIGMGDSFLPKPLSTISRQTRTSINQSLLGLMPNPKIRKPSEQHDAEVTEMEERVKGNRDQLVDEPNK
ncbi:hypothetical protein VB715_04105 [Crocosphaera sp. UHCC 0190]|uniref:hypothetical protein n=1 Tax=Crocosphaera sp. UHCC 0190 TaxID=3110246 RepID=UPI002B1ED7E1|nr:hypothetical protein [Crocosphaera sp. UHCC 0190]MEA5508939.1 hypothetical protein [Crocosphaera sp. UHCC 0190]